MWIKFKLASYLALRDEASRTHLKNRILVQDRGGAEFQTGGILLYVEDLKRGTNKDIFYDTKGLLMKIKTSNYLNKWEA
jgi:hypothetical protein